jgi:Protein of unknown function (DUF2793)
MDTINLTLPLIAAGQAQKHVTHNEALMVLDDLAQLVVVDENISAPPNNPTEGSRYIVGASPTGTWLGHTGQITVWRNNNWSFYLPRKGWLATKQDDGRLLVYDGTSWQPQSRFPFLGINATADIQNRLTVASENTLFTHAGAGHRLKINKANAGQTASILFQSNFSGRAEIGLNATDALSFKTSPDGQNWLEALRVEANGSVTMPNTQSGFSNANMLINGEFNINQRAFAGGALAQDVYGYDRWKAGTGGANLSVVSGTLTLTSGSILQPLEPEQWGLTSLAGQSLTISVQQPTAAVDVQIGGASGVIQSTTGRGSVTLTIPANAAGTLSLRLARSGAGAVSFRQVKLELGATATPWLARPLTQEQLLAQRYYYRMNGPLSLFLYAQATGNYFFNSLPLPVSMRTTPIVSRIVATSGNIFQNDLANATAAGLSPGTIRLSVRANAAGECYANFDRVECNAEL